MKTNHSSIQRLIDYLEKTLCQNNRHQFTKVGLRCFFYKDDVNMIFVKVTDENLIIITDGNNVADGLEMRRICYCNEGDENYVYNDYLQDILHKF